MYRLFALAVTCLWITSAQAQSIAPREGWVVIETGKAHATLLADLKKAVKANKMGVVTQAGPTGAARNRGIAIPENRVIGVFNNDFAVKVLATSTAAMIEAPIRFYVTEEADGAATLSYKTPGFVFAPYLDEGGQALADLAAELDAKFNAIATAASQ
ncbi:DUF302 domain-containing protein [uncultured Roseobacter sp.]|uniref:DUF302 domain-containing protein n=1 Tax=uncultured Roseobacter sp. TaxID=114847 RepID=UPI0026064C51|nr:DUF302 domain-containing protein [uncultured Roseobacter sp.]